MDASLPNERDLQCNEGDSSFDGFKYESSDRSSERDCSDCDIYSSCSSENKDEPHNHRMRCGPHNEAHIGRVRGRKSELLQEVSARVNKFEEGYVSSDYVSSDHSSEHDCSDCGVYSSCSSEAKEEPHNHRLRCGLHNEAHIGRVKGRKSKALQEASAMVTEEEVEAMRQRRGKFQQSPDSFLDEYFPGGSAFAHHLSDRWEKEKQDKVKQLQQDQVKARRLQELGKIQAAMLKKRKKKK